MSAPPPYNATHKMAPQPAPPFNPPPPPVYVTAPAPPMAYAPGVAPQPLSPMRYQPEGPPPDSSPGPTIVGGAIGPNPAFTTCPGCRQQVTTNIIRSSGLCTWLLCLGVFCFTGCCCWIPFVIDDTKDATHMCPRCGYIVGQYKRM